MLVLSEEIKKKLTELNLTTAAPLVRLRKQWFASRKINLMIVDCKYYVQREDYTTVQLIAYIDDLNGAYKNLLSFLPKDYTFKKSFFTKEGEIIKEANEILEIIKEKVKSLKEKNVNVKLVSREYYIYVE